jgi:hypothetical protein
VKLIGIRVGAARFVVSAGHTGAVSVPLSRAALTLIARAPNHRIAARVQATVGDARPSPVTRVVVLERARHPKPKRRRRPRIPSA